MTPANIRSKDCPSQKLLALIADKWSSMLIYILSDRTVRYLQLQREVEGISQKMLTQTLQNLERHGIVHRTVYAVVPPRVEYSLTPLGRTLVPKLCGLCTWCEENMEAVEVAKRDYDGREKG